jgi:hypothetical protein
VLSLREAAQLAGTSKSSILRAVKAGRLSAQRNDQGEFKVDPAEVARVYDKGSASHRGRRAPPDQGEAGDRSDLVQRSDGVNQATPVYRTDPVNRTTALEAESAALKSENAALKELIRRLDQDKQDLKTDRDIWRAQAERLALAGPPRRSWWPWRRLA